MSVDEPWGLDPEFRLPVAPRDVIDADVEEVKCESVSWPEATRDIVPKE